MQELVYNGNKIVLYNSGEVTAFFVVGEDDDWEIESRDFKSLQEARVWLDENGYSKL